jgi:hypothetical protein
MERDELFLQEVISEIEKELENIDRLREELRNALRENSLLSRRAEGSILHDFYNCCERVFKKISMGINGGFNEGERWHKELLYRMTIPIRGIRPEVISEDLAAELDDYLSFRHIFRNIYGFELKGERLDRLVEKFDRTSNTFEREIRQFLEKFQKD